MAATLKEYLLPSELTVYYDVRRVVGLISDTGIPVDSSDLSSFGSAGYSLVQKLIRSVSARIDSRCQQGKRYSRTDLETLAYEARTADIGTDTQYEAKQKRFAILSQLTADLLYGDILSRRGYSADEFKKMAPRYEEALDLLEQLYQGIAIFDLDGPKNSGIPSIQTLGKNVLHSTDFNRMFGLWPNSQAQNPYGLFGSWRY